ncbi:type II toxin-antitoxin system RelE/ParE family toxin [Mycoplana sp. MJR14]|nr:type II toxin-antitoxin system RelE/ParE family toxin [Mycoplana sp. MJR14]MDF1632173.1 type II toxin-antitoxin system RelE/ParE family toxin [Mycoplana sp. MJR14]
MSVASFQFTDSATADVDAILSYTLKTWGDDQAVAYVGGLYELLGLLSANPASGRLRRDLSPELRSFPYREHVVFYVPSGDGIMVIRVLHGRQSVRSLLSSP